MLQDCHKFWWSQSAFAAYAPHILIIWYIVVTLLMLYVQISMNYNNKYGINISHWNEHGSIDCIYRMVWIAFQNLRQLLNPHISYASYIEWSKRAMYSKCREYNAVVSGARSPVCHVIIGTNAISGIYVSVQFHLMWCSILCVRFHVLNIMLHFACHLVTFIISNILVCSIPSMCNVHAPFIWMPLCELCVLIQISHFRLQTMCVRFK